MKYKILAQFLLSLLLYSCDSDWLEVKRDQQLVVPQTLDDLQALMDNTVVFNVGQTPVIGEISTDDYYVSDNDWAGATTLWQKNAYIWEKDIFNGVSVSGNGWDLVYRQVFYSNVVLESLSKIERNNNNAARWDKIKGTALFWRSWAFFHLAQIYCLPYDARSEQTLGIPLVLESDINIRYSRSSLKETYDQILTDLEAAVTILPVQVTIPTQPSAEAGYGLLSKVYLVIGSYQKAYDASDIVLRGQSLLDYNTVSASPDFPFEQFNQEVILETSLQNYTSGLLAQSKMLVDSVLLKSYDQHDLRVGLFYRNVNNGMTFKGNYTGRNRLFSGIARDEIYLNKLECAVRLKKTKEANEMLDSFMKSRIKNDRYTPLNFKSDDELLGFVLLQRRLQLAFRGIRWSDIKRMNANGGNVIVERVLNGITYKLSPGSSKYALQIPPDVISINPLIIQNVRD